MLAMSFPKFVCFVENVQIKTTGISKKLEMGGFGIFRPMYLLIRPMYLAYLMILAYLLMIIQISMNVPMYVLFILVVGAS